MACVPARLSAGLVAEPPEERGRFLGRFGGHLLPGSAVYTTAEIVLLILSDLAFDRAPCPRSGYDELVVTRAPREAPTTSEENPA